MVSDYALKKRGAKRSMKQIFFRFLGYPNVLVN